jgi:hypothetical protein
MDQYGQVIGVLVAEKRDPSATGRFVTHALEHGLRSTHQQPDQAEPGALQSPPAADAGPHAVHSAPNHHYRTRIRQDLRRGRYGLELDTEL